MAAGGLTAASKLSAAMQSINTGRSHSSSVEQTADGEVVHLPLTQSQHHVEERHQHQQSTDGRQQLDLAARYRTPPAPG